MNRYRAHVTVTTTWMDSEEVSFEIEAENEEEALKTMEESYSGHCNANSILADQDSQYIEDSNLELIEGDNTDLPTLRCEKTIDMFGTTT